jgi:hypothetical protein
MIKSIKRMVLTGAAVMVMMSFAAPAMADDYAQRLPVVPPLSYPQTPIKGDPSHPIKGDPSQ